MAFRPDELASAHPWRLAAFTTYALSLSFFESVVLDALVRGRSQQALVLADAEGVRSALSEQGAQRAGRDYEVEPVAMDAGVFHPKVTAFVGRDECHLLVGSGNLTFNGWGNNLELIEHLHPSFAADAFEDAARFFSLLGESRTAVHGARNQCLALSEELRSSLAGRPRDGSFRLLHSLDGPVSSKMKELADDLGGATALAVASPFWDGGPAIDALCRALELDSVRVHAHPGGTVHGTAGTNWPFAAEVEVIPVEASPFSDGRDHRLHAKAFEVMCRRGRLVVSGSANATRAALSGDNVEACVARIQRERLVGWTFVKAAVPEPVKQTEDDEQDDAGRSGVLRAAVSGDRITGMVLVPKMTGRAQLSRVSPEGNVPLADVELDATGAFDATLPGFELESLRRGRVVLRIEAGTQAAEGFASLSAVTGLRRFAGKAAASVMAVLTGTETPDDVRVLMEWAHDNPNMLRTAFRIGGGDAPGGNGHDRPSMIARADLWNTDPLAGGAAAGHGGNDPGWTRFVDALFAALRERRGPIVHDPEPEDEGEGRRNAANGSRNRKKNAPKKSGPLEIFEKVFEAMLPKGASCEAAFRAFDLASYVCDRLPRDVTPDKAAAWLRKIVETFCADGVPGERVDDVRSAIMAVCGPAPDGNAAKLARGRIMQIGCDPAAECPPEAPAEAFRRAMGHETPYADAWAAVQTARTWREQARAYVDALEAGVPGDGYGELLSAVSSEAALMREAFQSEQARRKVIVLPGWSPSCCRMQLPRMEANKLMQYGVARSANCCQKVLVWPEGADA